MSDDDEKEKQSNIEENASRWGQSVITFIKKSLSIVIRIAKGAVKGITKEIKENTIGQNIEAHIKFDLSLKSRPENKSNLPLKSQQENKSDLSLKSWQENNLKSIYHKSEKYEVKDEREKEVKNLNPEWGASFIDKSKNISDEDMQTMWAKILAGERDNPGAFSKRTLSVVNNMDKEDAELFTVFCQFVWWDDCNKPIVLFYQNDFQHKHPIYQSGGIDFDSLEHLESMGLIRCAFTTMLAEDKLGSEHKTWHYHDIPVKIKGDLLDLETNRYYIPVGYVMLTQMGRELAPVSGANRNDEFFNYVIDKWKRGGHNPVIQNPVASKEND